MARILVLQHHKCEVLGTIETALEEAGFSYRYVRGFAGEAVPKDVHAADGLVLLGGPLSVHAQDRFPFLRDEIGLIQAALQEQKPVLGICLGSQLLAAALGARVSRGESREIGWLPVYLTPAGSEDQLFGRAPASFVTCIWHGDVFEVPPWAACLAYSDKTACKAFRYGDAAYGLLFHLEVTPGIVACAVNTFAAQLEAARLDKEECISDGNRFVPAVQQIGRTVFKEWTALCERN